MSVFIRRQVLLRGVRFLFQTDLNLRSQNALLIILTALISIYLKLKIQKKTCFSVFSVFVLEKTFSELRQKCFCLANQVACSQSLDMYIIPVNRAFNLHLQYSVS